MRTLAVVICALMAIMTAAMALLMYLTMPNLSSQSFPVHVLIYTMQATLCIVPLVFGWVGYLFATRRF